MKNTTLRLSIVSLLLLAFVVVPIISFANYDTGDKRVGIGIDANVVLGSDEDVDADMEEEASMNPDEQVDSEGNVYLESNITDKSLRVNTAGLAVVSSTQVTSEEDLEIFSENIARRDSNVSDINVRSNDKEIEVVVAYKHRGKFLGFIPVRVRSSTDVAVKADEKIEVESRLSWWSFLVANKDYNKSELESQIKNNANIKANAKVDATAAGKANIIEAIIAEINANAAASAEANTY